jgi:hypothetical protein
MITQIEGLALECESLLSNVFDKFEIVHKLRFLTLKINTLRDYTQFIKDNGSKVTTQMEATDIQ